MDDTSKRIIGVASRSGESESCLNEGLRFWCEDRRKRQREACSQLTFAQEVSAFGAVLSSLHWQRMLASIVY